MAKHRLSDAVNRNTEVKAIGRAPLNGRGVVDSVQFNYSDGTSDVFAVEDTAIIFTAAYRKELLVSDFGDTSMRHEMLFHWVEDWDPRDQPECGKPTVQAGTDGSCTQPKGHIGPCVESMRAKS